MPKSNTNERPDLESLLQRLWSEKFASARVVFCGGSVVRGEGYPRSDLDVVVVFDHVPNAWRESFEFIGWPVEAFVHDPETLAYFVNADRARRRPALAQMICEGVAVPACEKWATAIRAWARDIIAEHPGVVESEALAADRYLLCDLLDDFVDERPRDELVASEAEAGLGAART